jgi:hypothetical protein
MSRPIFEHRGLRIWIIRPGHYRISMPYGYRGPSPEAIVNSAHFQRMVGIEVIADELRGKFSRLMGRLRWW